MLRIGRIAYANCTPIFYGLDSLRAGQPYQFVAGVPSYLNAMLAAGSIDVCPSSSFEYARNFENYLILPDLSISSDGPVGSVLLFSRVPIEELDGKTILLSAESATSVNLLRILIHKRFHCTCRFTVSADPLESALLDAPAMLLIGDTALRESLRNSGLHVYDLGGLWRDWTGLPFVFALWLSNRTVALEQSDNVVRLVRELVASKVHSRKGYEQIAQVSPESVWMGTERLIAYWTDNISYDLDRRHQEGLELFFRYCVELGLLEKEPPLHFLELP